MKKHSSKKNISEEKKSHSLKAIALILILMIGGAFFLFWKYQSKSEVMLAPEFPQSYSEPSFDDFVGAWNDKARAYDLSEAHLLSSTDNQKLLDELKKYTDGFAFTPPKKIMIELQALSQNYPRSIWAMYKDFLTSYTGKKQQFSTFNWENVKSSEDLQELIQDVTGKNDFDEAIKLILASSDPCAYFNLYKVELRKRGLSRNYKKCSVDQLDTANFPEVANLIR